MRRAGGKLGPGALCWPHPETAGARPDGSGSLSDLPGLPPFPPGSRAGRKAPLLGLEHQPLSLGSRPRDPNCPRRFQPAGIAQTLCSSKAASWSPTSPSAVSGTPGWSCRMAPCRWISHFAQNGGGPWPGKGVMLGWHAGYMGVPSIEAAAGVWGQPSHCSTQRVGICVSTSPAPAPPSPPETASLAEDLPLCRRRKPLASPVQASGPWAQGAAGLAQALSQEGAGPSGAWVLLFLGLLCLWPSCSPLCLCPHLSPGNLGCGKQVWLQLLGTQL